MKGALTAAHAEAPPSRCRLPGAAGFGFPCPSLCENVFGFKKPPGFARRSSHGTTHHVAFAIASLHVAY